MNDFMVLDGNGDDDDGECYLDEECPLVSKGQLCIHGVCAFECLGNNDCPRKGKCDFHSNLCKWSGKLTPPTTSSSSTTTTTKETESPSSPPTATTTSLNNVENLIIQQQQQQQFNSTTDTDSSNSTSNNVASNANNPLITPIVLGIVITLLTIGILFLLVYLLRKRKAKNKSTNKIKRSKLSNSSIAPSEMRYRSTSKNNNNGNHKSIIHTAATKTTASQQTTLFNYEGEDDEDEERKEEFEETFAEGAVGYSASENLGDQSLPPIQSQTVYGNSASSTSMIELQTASHLPVLQEHHFMSSQDGYSSPHLQLRDDNDDDQTNVN